MKIKSAIYSTFLVYYCVQGWESEPRIDCWEECFYEGDYQDQESYKSFYNLGHFVKLHRMLENVNGTFFVLDSSLTDKKDVSYFQFMKDLIKFLAFLIPAGSYINPFFIGQFNQDFAW